MALQIKTTGVEDYLDGSANIKMLVVGDPGAGKTRMSSFWPKPIYADIESGRGSLRDRKMPYVEIRNSKQMLDFLAELRRLEQSPKAMRQFQTVVIDTLDGFQRKVKDEWLIDNKAGVFSGFDAWGYLDTKMQALMTRLLNLDYNVIVTAHLKDKRGGPDDPREFMLQLQGDIKDTVFNDFDLIGFLGTYYVAENGEKVKKRGLTFHETTDKPFLKDRFGIMPRWIPIEFAEQDYQQVFDAFLKDLEDLPEQEILGEIPEHSGSDDIRPSIVGPQGGALPASNPKDAPLASHDKVTLATMARELGITTTVDGTPIRGNTLKGELIAAIEKHKATPATPAESGADNAPAESAPTPETAPATSAATAPEAPAAPAAEQDATPAAAAPPIETLAAGAATEPEPEPVANAGADAAPQAAAPETPAADSGLAAGETVNPETGEITHDQAIANVQEGLDAEVESDTGPVEEEPQASEPEPAPAATPTAPPASEASPAQKRPEFCEQDGCGKPLATEIPQYVQLSGIKFKKFLCNEHYLERRRAVATS